MSTGTPILISSSGPVNFEKLKKIAFSRQDSASFDESLLQQIIDENPGLLPIRDFYPSANEICSLGREIQVDLGERQGFIDNLLITDDGHLVLVETKLYRNPEAVRDAVVQTLEYGMALQKMSINSLEGRLRAAKDSFSAIKPDETIHSRASSGMSSIRSDFESELERYLRTGEILLLVVADGIRVSVERITKWMNETLTGGSPIKFGLIELQFYSNSKGERLVFPKTLLRTIEISRHVVVVDIQNNTNNLVESTISDESSGVLSTKKIGKIISAEPPMTKQKLISIADSGDQPILQTLFMSLEGAGFIENTKTSAQLRYGVAVPEFGDVFYPILYMTKGSVWCQPTKSVRELVGDEAILEFRRKLNPVVQFFRPDELASVDGSGVGVRYSSLKENIPEFIVILEEFKQKIVTAIEDEYSRV